MFRNWIASRIGGSLLQRQGSRLTGPSLPFHSFSSHAYPNPKQSLQPSFQGHGFMVEYMKHVPKSSAASPDVHTVAKLSFANPPVNALTLNLLLSLKSFLEQLHKEKGNLPPTSALVLQSSVPNVFSAGLDLMFLIRSAKERSLEFHLRIQHYMSIFQECARLLLTLPIPTVALVEGVCPAGGTVFSLCCEHRIATSTPKRFSMGLNEVAVGMAPPQWVHQLAIQAIGSRAAAKMVTSGTLLFSPNEAMKAGFLDSITPTSGELVQGAKSFIDAQLDLPPIARADAKFKSILPILQHFTPQGLEAVVSSIAGNEFQNKATQVLESLKRGKNNSFSGNLIATTEKKGQKGGEDKDATSSATLSDNNKGSKVDSISGGRKKSQDGGEPISGLLNVRVVEARNVNFPLRLDLSINPKLSAETDEAAGRNMRTPYAIIEFDKNELISIARDVDVGKRTLSWNQKTYFDVSRVSELSLSVFVPVKGEDGLASTINVGQVKFLPVFSKDPVDNWYPFVNEQSRAKGEIRLQTSFTPVESNTIRMEQFDLLKVIGKGSFGKVMQVRKKDTNRIYAMKIIKKSYIVERDEVSHTLAERTVLAKLKHPFIIPLKYSFQNSEKLYLVLAFVNGGELFFHLQQEGRFKEDRAKFYAAELMTALDCLHSHNIIYRDLKPENILLDYSGHIALCDFGLCKLNMSDGNKTNTFCGTPEYLAPEVLLNLGYTKTVDWWTLGILLYEMIGGLPPFYDENVNEMYNKILNDPLVFRKEMSADAKDLLSKLLNRDPALRLGANGAAEIKQHPFFASIDWNKLLARQYTPAFRPDVSSAMDTSNFDEEFTSEPATDSHVEASELSASIQQQFNGFTFKATEAISGSISNSMAAGTMLDRPSTATGGTASHRVLGSVRGNGGRW